MDEDWGGGRGKDRDLRGIVRNRQEFAVSLEQQQQQQQEQQMKAVEISGCSMEFLGSIQKANNGMVLVKLLLAGWKTRVPPLFFMRNAGNIQET